MVEQSKQRTNSTPLTRRTASEELHKHIRARGLISSAALGLSDGLVTNLAFLAGFAGAVSDINIIRYAGLAAMLAGAVSMFFGGVLSARSEHSLFQADSKREAYEIQHEPEEERQELKDLYAAKGLAEKEADLVVNRISSNREKWLEDILMNELHLHESELRDPYQVGAVIGASFLVGAFIPFSAYLLVSVRNYSIIASVTVSLIFLFAAGYWNGHIVGKNTLRSGLETLAIGAIASAILYAIGSALVFI